MTDSFFEEAQATGGPARKRGKPMLVPHGAPKDVRSAYTRASSFADRIENKDFLERWKMRYLARGMAENEDLRLLAASEIYTTGFGRGDLGENRASGMRLDSIIERALDRMGISERADYGTAVHAYCVEDGPRPVDMRVKDDVDAYYACLEAHGIVVVQSEVFIANDDVMAAGTLDDLIIHPECGLCIGDKKTGKLSEGFAVQLAIYANGEPYDTDTDERGKFDDINLEVAFLFAIKDGKCEMYEVDIAAGWRIAEQIFSIYELYNMSLFDKIPTPAVVSISDMIDQSQSADEMVDLWQRTKHRWTDQDKAHAKTRRAELEAK